MQSASAQNRSESRNRGLNSSFESDGKSRHLDENRRYSGRLKFFDEAKNYGFIVMDEDGSDIFVHYDDLVKANLSKDLLKTAKKGNNIKLSFGCHNYVGKHKNSKKAVDIEMMP